MEINDLRNSKLLILSPTHIKIDYLIVDNPNFFETLSNMFNKISLDDWKNFFIYKIVKSSALYINERKKVISDIGSLIKDNGYGLITARPFSTVAGESICNRFFNH